MILLAATTDSLEVVTGQAVTVDVHASFMDASSADPPVVKGSTSNKQNTAISTAATTIVVAAPGATTLRTIKTLTIRNKHASASVDVTVQFNQNGTRFELYKVTLSAQATLMYVEGVGFFVLPSAQTNPLLTTTESDVTQRCLINSALATGAPGTFLTITGTAYFVYVGRLARDSTIQFVRMQVSTIGAGTQVAEVGLFSSPLAPNKSAQVLTKLVATGTVDTLITTGYKQNTTTFNQLVTAGTHLWAAIRTAMATTQPTFTGYGNDMGEGHILTTTGGGALTAVTQTSGSIVPALAVVTVAPQLHLTLD